MTTLDEFNRLSITAARKLILQCCASSRWADDMVAARPYSAMNYFTTIADVHWRAMAPGDILEALRGHPTIGQADFSCDKSGLAAAEQSGMARASDSVAALLAKHNHAYIEKFGFIFIVCASGKSAQQMLNLLRARMGNTLDEEIANAADEQGKITQLRIRKLFSYSFE